MLSGIYSYWMFIVAPGFGTIVYASTNQFPRGTNVHATIALSYLNTDYYLRGPDPLFSASAFISSYARYKPDGTLEHEAVYTQPNALGIDDCAYITFGLYGAQVAATAQINVIVK
jgi:hypothetical protein